MGILSLFQRKQKNTQVVLKSNNSLERAADSILSQRGKQIVDGINKPTASTGTPMDKLHGGAKRMAQMSNIGGGSNAVSKNDVGENAVIIPILRAGMSMSNRLTKRLPKADVARISMRRNLHTLKPFVAWDEFEQIKEPESKRVFITDPALATAGSILKTLEHMKKYGFKDENVVIMAMFGCQSGIERIFKEHPEVKLFLVHMADGIREDGYLLPYNGDTGDRLYGVRENEYVI